MPLYEHPNSRTREQQANARRRAEQAVKAGSIAWDSSKGLSGGFAYRNGKRIETTAVLLLIALCELRDAGYIGVNVDTGRVWWVQR